MTSGLPKKLFITMYPLLTSMASNDNSPGVDIIIPVCNGFDFIDKCIDSIEKKSYTNYKVYFVVSVDSADGSINKLNDIATNNPNVSVILRDVNTSVGYARNLGLNKSSNELVWFFDIDDYVYPTFLEEMVKITIEERADVVFCNFFLEHNEKIPEIPAKDYTVKRYDNYTAVGLFDELPTFPWAHIQRRSLFENGQIYYYDVPTSEDLDQIIRELSLSKSVCYYNKPLYVYYKRKTSLTKTNRQLDGISIETIARRTIPFVKKYSYENYENFRLRILQRLMRQIAFVKYKEYSRIYKDSIAHELIEEMSSKTKEVIVFSHSKFLYYLILFPFTHWLWDKKGGLWRMIK